MRRSPRHPADAADELDVASASIGLTAPPGLRDWYCWRNRPGPLAPDSPAFLIGRFAAVDVATALEVRAIELDATAAVPEDSSISQDGSPSWLVRARQVLSPLTATPSQARSSCSTHTAKCQRPPTIALPPTSPSSSTGT